MQTELPLLFLLGVTVSSLTSVRADWPQFLGPSCNGIKTNITLASAWPKDGPKQVWSKKIGQGFSGPVVSGNTLILFHRIENQETIEAMDALSGKTLWTAAYRTRYRDDFGFDEGPRATPAIAEGKVYTLGAEGELTCLDLAEGKKIWSVSTKDRFQAPKGFFGVACSPLVESGLVLLNIGGKDSAGIVAFHQDTGKLAWKTSDHEASYSSPVAATIRGSRQALFFTRKGLLSLDPKSGKVLHEFNWRPRMSASVSAATPLVIGELIFVSASYGTGAVLLRAGGDRLEKVWDSDEALSNHYATSVFHQGHLFGFHGRQEEGPSLRCVELQTGKVKWSEERCGAGTLTLAGRHLLIMLEDGRLILGEADPEKFSRLGEAQILPFQVRAYPALGNGLFYARSKDRLACVDLRFVPGEN